MGLFSGKKEEKKVGIPSLPEFPKLSDFEEENSLEKIHKLPSLPYSSLGTKFSQDTIKEAVAGEKEEFEDNEGFPDARDLDSLETEDGEDSDEMRMMQKPLRKPLTEEVWERTPEFGRSGFSNGRNIGEPVFIRIDKFEEALKIFSEAKKKVSHIEQILSEIRKIKEKEENEIKSWENEVRSMKDQIEKADRDIFSKI